MSITSNLTSLKNKIPTENKYFKLISIVSICIFIILIIMYIIKNYRFNKLNPIFFRKSKNAMEKKKIPRKLIHESKSGYVFTWSFWFYLDDWNYKFKKWKHILTRGIYSSETDIEENLDNKCISRTYRTNVLDNYNKEIILLKAKQYRNDIDPIEKERAKNTVERLESAKNQFNSSWNCKTNYACQLGKNGIGVGRCVEESALKLQKQCKLNVPKGGLYACEDGYTCKNIDRKSRFGKCELVENNISEESPLGMNDTVSPAVYFHPNTNNIVIFMSTENGFEKIMIEDIPLQEWCQITIVLNRLNMDVYNNGRLSKTYIFNSPPKTIDGDVYINQDGGFSGELSSINYSPNIISPKELITKYSKGPSQISLIQKLLIKTKLIKPPVRPMSPEFQAKANAPKPDIFDKIESKIKNTINDFFNREKEKGEKKDIIINTDKDKDKDKDIDIAGIDTDKKEKCTR